ncbi:EamA domain-containing membrane protein RarD [Pseudooceanicola antarcticus]|uniref:EamA domain-containing membrane protein RarD n=1 Tax=Pseudooceanicola antarcticus TaxID=1247613 RepID=A0A285J883_9RHOB|nr:DMT family transporter [Pseudooceanicola antarcticus]PJE27086.1 EamA/RhaT family transporter [Pseudooceanicola antarcticus]SNY56432.1 EamA domain-containing membrane protein RarD [Pseudooceanicola antarcticus]
MTPAELPVENPTRGILLRLLSGLLFAGMVVMVKALSEDIPLGEIVFFRSAFALIPLVIFLRLRGEFPAGLRSKLPWGHVLRSGFGAAAMFTSFASIARLPVAEATLIGYLSPVLTAIAGVVLLGERATPYRVGGIALGLAGVAVLVGPELGAGPMDRVRLAGLALGVATAVLTSLALAMTRSLARSGESPGAIAFYFALTSALAGLLTLSSGWIMPSSETLILLVLAGLMGGFAHIAMTLAFRYAEASRLAPFEYVSLVWAVLADLLIFGLPVGPVFFLALPLLLGGAALAALERGRRQP